jgi:hypothetical protein
MRLVSRHCYDLTFLKLENATPPTEASTKLEDGSTTPQHAPAPAATGGSTAPTDGSTKLDENEPSAAEVVKHIQPLLAKVQPC